MKTTGVVSLTLGAIFGVLLATLVIGMRFYDFYIWVIEGPYPFSHLGSAPFQIAFFGLSFLVLIALLVTGFVCLKSSKQ